MSINLQKGQKIDLTKGGAGLNRIMVGLGWDEVERPRGMFSSLFGGKQQDIDCDASVICLGENGRVVSPDVKQSLVYFGNLTHPSGAIVHQGDNLTGAGEGDDEQIMIDLPRVPSNIHELVFTVNIYDGKTRNQHFGMIRNAFIRVVDMAKNTELCRFNLSEGYEGMTGLVVAKLYRRNGEWKFSAMGEPVKDASRLDSLVKMFSK